ncbi:hypothetical protein N7510_011321 [Penicillium lagena]|uniref:uncharacterized protein n=1 Tax=Penicillium lagena TaxID=94218 RepID=UPI00253F8058|nr:uncharacterized protein N7510_011321 [Penicillium lagena]KAJ5601787.1 hypothetical protein N7510_011321 [Penicillium lagena]
MSEAGQSSSGGPNSLDSVDWVCQELELSNQRTTERGSTRWLAGPEDGIVVDQELRKPKGAVDDFKTPPAGGDSGFLEGTWNPRHIRCLRRIVTSIT